MGAALAHLVREDTPDPVPSSPAVDPVPVAAPSGSSPAVTEPTDPAGWSTADVIGATDPAGPPVPEPLPRKASRPRTAPTGATGTGTAARVARLKAEHPDLTNAAIAKRLRVSVRTVSRHLNPPATDPTGPDPTATSTDPSTTSTDPSTTDSDPDIALTETGDDVSRAA
jgi:hypothetical protein